MEWECGQKAEPKRERGKMYSYEEQKRTVEAHIKNECNARVTVEVQGANPGQNEE